VTTGAGASGAGASGPTHQRMASDIWSVADLLRGHYIRHEYGEVILPLTVLRRLDAVMAPTRQAVWDRDAALTSQGIRNKDRPLQLAAKLPFYNTSGFDFAAIAWIDHDKTKIGYEIPFTRHFYVYTPPRPLAEIDAELRDLESQIQKLLGEVTG
jgi:type I restriction-modification system DNA methylase subunit